MLVAVPLEEEKGLDSRLSEHFGKAPHFAFVEIREGKVTSWKIEKNTLEHGAVPDHLIARGVDLVLTRHIGPHAKEKLVSFGVRVAYATEDTLSQILSRLTDTAGEERP